jgi:hypothetical protein
LARRLSSAARLPRRSPWMARIVTPAPGIRRCRPLRDRRAGPDPVQVVDLPAQPLNVTSFVSVTPAVRPGAAWYCQ